MENHAQGGTILDRAGGVIALQLHQQGIGGVRAKALQPDQRGITNVLFQGGIVLGQDGG